MAALTRSAATRGLIAFMLALFVHTSFAQDAQSKARAELEAAFSAAQKVHTRGPSNVPLADQAVLKLPEGFVYIPPAEGARLLTAMGNRVGDGLLGLIFPSSQEDWLVVLQLEKAGFIKDEDAKTWNVDDLLSGIKAGTDEANKDRRSRGIPEMEIIGWVEAPAYDASTQR